MFPHLSKVFSRDARLAELFKRPQLQPKSSSDKLNVCVEVSTKTDAVVLNFYHWCKTPSSAFSKKFQRRPPIFCTFSVEPLVIYNCAVYNSKLSHHLRDIRLVSIPWPWNPVLGVTQGHRKLYHSMRNPWLPINVP